jgi:hypothetical protein
MTIRKNTTVTVTTVIDGSKRVKVRQKGERRVQRVDSYQIHAEVLERALNLAGGDKSRLDWRDATVVDGVITEIRILNKPKGR